MADQTYGRTMGALGKVLDTITPWLLELGSWLFGALIAFSLVILAALLNIGPHDGAILVAAAAFAIALPLDVAGFLVLRLAADMKNVALQDVTAMAFGEVGLPADDRPPAAVSAQTREKRRARSVLGYSYTLLAVSMTVTLVGLTGALWHMAWWIAAVFLVMVVVSSFVAVLAIASKTDPLGLTDQS